MSTRWPYDYLSYDFSNRSREIVDLFVAACARVGVRCRLTGPSRRGLWGVRINRRPSMELMVANVGLKA